MPTIVEARELKALEIVSIGAQVKRVSDFDYKVKSQTSDQWYSVTKANNQTSWICTCPDHIYRKQTCKHIYAVSFSIQLRTTIVPRQDAVEVVTAVSSKIECPKCQSIEIIKDGIRHTKHGTDIQRYSCRVCHFRFALNSGFERARADAKVITAALDLYFKGISLRKVCDHLKQFYGIEVSHVAIIKWIRKFVKVVGPYVDQLVPPHISGIYHVDEMMVHVRKESNEKGHYQWLWNLMDNTTRFWICSKISQKREICDARVVFKQAKERVPRQPKAVVHDGLWSYNDAFKKEFWIRKGPQTKNIRSVSVRHEGLNSKVERLNGSVREREVVMRGMDHAKSAQALMEALRIYYNYIRTHQGLDGKTPAEASGIKIGGVNRWLSLIRGASAHE